MSLFTLHVKRTVTINYFSSVGRRFKPKVRFVFKTSVANQNEEYRDSPIFGSTTMFPEQTGFVLQIIFGIVESSGRIRYLQKLK